MSLQCTAVFNGESTPEMFCAWCMRDMGITAPDEMSHGICDRHAVEFLKEAGLDPEKVLQFQHQEAA